MITNRLDKDRTIRLYNSVTKIILNDVFTIVDKMLITELGKRHNK